MFDAAVNEDIEWEAWVLFNLVISKLLFYL